MAPIVFFFIKLYFLCRQGATGDTIRKYCPERIEREDNMLIEQFKEKLCMALQEVMGEQYSFKTKEIVRNNGICCHAILFIKKGSNVSPAIYLETFFEAYKEGKSMGDIVFDILCVYRKYAKEIRVDMNFFTSYDKVRQRIFYKLIHKDRNEALLMEVPYKTWQDLALVYYYAFEDAKIGKAAIMIRNSYLQMWNIDKDTLFGDAERNMRTLLPEYLIPMQKMLREIMWGETPEADILRLPGELSLAMAKDADISMYILSNREKMYGAASLLYSESMRQLAGQLGRNLIILPSSVHEVLLVPDNGHMEKEFFLDMVKEVNDTHVDPEEILSYNVYYYDRQKENICILQ